MSTFARSAKLKELIFSKGQIHGITKPSVGFVRDPLKAQDRPMDISVTEYKRTLIYFNILHQKY